jgi:hypothetical protein
MLCSGTIVYDANVLGATREIITHYITAWEFTTRDARYSLKLPTGATLDPAHSGYANRQIIW